MSLPRFVDQINQLFDELIRDPWATRSPLAAPPQRREPTARQRAEWAIEIPAGGALLSDLSLKVDGRRLTVAMARQSARRASRGGTEVTRKQEQHVRQSFLLPEGADLNSLEARFENGVLHVSVDLRTRS